jgi:hypothetical protein
MRRRTVAARSGYWTRGQPFTSWGSRVTASPRLHCTLEARPRRLLSFSSMRTLLSEFWAFLRTRKKWWLAPIVIILLLFGSLIVFTQGSALAPFIYTIF